MCLCVYRHGLNSFDYKPLSWLGQLERWSRNLLRCEDYGGTSRRKCVGAEGLVLVELDNQVMRSRELDMYLEARTYMCEPAAQKVLKARSCVRTPGGVSVAPNLVPGRMLTQKQEFPV